MFVQLPALPLRCGNSASHRQNHKEQSKTFHEYLTLERLLTHTLNALYPPVAAHQLVVVEAGLQKPHHQQEHLLAGPRGWFLLPHASLPGPDPPSRGSRLHHHRCSTHHPHPQQLCCNSVEKENENYGFFKVKNTNSMKILFIKNFQVKRTA